MERRGCFVKRGVQRMECRMTWYVPDVENGTVYIKYEEQQGDIGPEDGKVYSIHREWRSAWCIGCGKWNSVSGTRRTACCTVGMQDGFRSMD